ncbi:unnamed protein product [Gongylonema pulchrum]|uniref:Protein yellow n=1 Tax=Gongylonema pulchrum TaxID=637853 RepID=A0A183DWX3_9BILA|nr:unnamed protein product [Gongylonema pulchrum]
MTRKLCLIVVLAAAFACRCFGLEFQCRDNENRIVDWFIFYKIGRIQESNNELIRNGSGFFYMDSNSRKWELPELGIDNPKQSVGHTLHQYYEVKNNPEVDFP